MSQTSRESRESRADRAVNNRLLRVLLPGEGEALDRLLEEAVVEEGEGEVGGGVGWEECSIPWLVVQLMMALSRQEKNKINTGDECNSSCTTFFHSFFFYARRGHTHTDVEQAGKLMIAGLCILFGRHVTDAQ